MRSEERAGEFVRNHILMKIDAVNDNKAVDDEMEIVSDED
jgi:hypothetical protein